MKSQNGNDFSHDSVQEEKVVFEKVSCQNESELSEGSRTILKNQQCTLFASFRWRLKNHHLEHRFSEYEIFGEAYRRATESVRKGKAIDNLYGWYKVTGYNIIREYSRQEVRQKRLRQKIIESVAIKPIAADSKELQLDEDSEIVVAIKRCVKNPLDIKIIFLRVLDDLSWMAVCQRLVAEGHLNCELSKQCEERVRQRFHRAVRKIQKWKE